MMLREELRRRLLEDRGIYVKEWCDIEASLPAPPQKSLTERSL